MPRPGYAGAGAATDQELRTDPGRSPVLSASTASSGGTASAYGARATAATDTGMVTRSPGAESSMGGVVAMARHSAMTARSRGGILVMTVLLAATLSLALAGPADATESIESFRTGAIENQQPAAGRARRSGGRRLRPGSAQRGRILGPEPHRSGQDRRSLILHHLHRPGRSETSSGRHLAGFLHHRVRGTSPAPARSSPTTWHRPRHTRAVTRTCRPPSRWAAPANRKSARNVTFQGPRGHLRKPERRYRVHLRRRSLWTAAPPTRRSA